MDISQIEKRATELYIKYNSVMDSYQTTLDSIRELSED